MKPGPVVEGGLVALKADQAVTIEALDHFFDFLEKLLLLLKVLIFVFVNLKSNFGVDKFTVNKTNLAIFHGTHIMHVVFCYLSVELIFWNRKRNFVRYHPIFEGFNLTIEVFKVHFPDKLAYFDQSDLILR